MAPTSVVKLMARYVECDITGRCYRRNSRWYDWGRWILIGILLLGLLLVLFSLSCIARRRRRRGAQPLYGTGWMAPAGKFGGHNSQQPMNTYQQGYDGQGYGPQGGYPPAPPAYGQPQHAQYTGTTGTTFNPNDGYYGDPAQQQQHYGVQQPPNAYQPNSPYSPPAGPPPGK
ncbi:hypothetical protein CDD83_10688 [Cordyceps sp. RAO-2017]|nr:hypothetical protein CDD83_10688 [Cordyceps sp. RAO-2017]